MLPGTISADLARLVDFLNSYYLPDRDDALGNGRAAGWLAEWLADRGGHGIDDGIDDAIRTRTEPTQYLEVTMLMGLRELRDGLRQLAIANNGEQSDRPAIHRAATALASVRLVIDLGDEQRAPRFTTPARATVTEQAFALVAQYYFSARVGKDWLRVKACAGPACRYAYLDTSRNRSRRWCEMAVCGNRAKNRAWRERRSAAPLSEVSA